MASPLKELRTGRKLTLQQVADHLTQSGIYPKALPSHVSKLEERGTDRYPILVALSELFGVSVEEMAVRLAPKKND